VGSQDQVLAAYGGLNHVTFLPNDEISVRPITIPGTRLQELASHLMLFYTGIKRTASDVAHSYVSHLEERFSRELCLMRELVDESLAILSSGQEITAFGELLKEAWEIKRRLGPSVSNPQVDAIYQSARSAGAIGGKLTGAGGGGFLLLFVPPPLQPEVMEALRDLVYVPFRFEAFGSQIIFFDPQEDYSALEARRARQSLRVFEELCAEETLPR
jgi:D-glycero-alpha-D-manno-heptose-7-phosphate kinase